MTIFLVLHASLNLFSCFQTRDHILALLDGPRKDSDAANATVLLKALQKTILFEKDSTSWLQRKFGAKFASNSESPEANTSGSEEEKVSADSSANLNQPILKPLIGTASVAFESYMDPYIQLEEKSMDEQLATALEDRTVDTRGANPVFISSTNLFVYMKGSITRCTALTKGSAFLFLYSAFKKSLRKYANIMNKKLPTPIANSAIPVNLSNIGIPGAKPGEHNGAKGKNANSYRLPPGEEVTVCHVISTCEYCADTTEALEDLIRDTIDEEHKKKIDMSSEQDFFHDTTAKSVHVLVSGLLNRTEPALKAMSSQNWGMWEAVGEESSYVRLIHRELQPMVSKIRGMLQTSYFRSFCDKFASMFMAEYYGALVRLKRINEPGTQQLLLDVYSLKTLFLKLPILGVGKSATTIAPAIYTKLVQKQFGHIETILKLVGTPNELLIENFKVQCSQGTAADLQTVMSLKGMKRNEQVAMLEKFGMDPASAVKGVTAGLSGAAIMSERVQALQDQGSTVAARMMNSETVDDFRQKVLDFRTSFR